MEIKQLIDEDFVNYKTPSMFIGFPSCSFKCDRDCGKKICQNSSLAKAKSFVVEPEQLVKRYLDNPISKSFVFGGLEPFDTWENLVALVSKIRNKTEDDIVIYTGYKKEEIEDKIEALRVYPNIIVKFGRFRPDQKQHMDHVLGINLASDNQYAEIISHQ